MTERRRSTGRPREPILSTSLIRDQALAIIDGGGLSTLTMRGLATRLGVQAASLYAHFPNKEAVLDAIAARIAKRIDTSDFDNGWPMGLRTWGTTYYEALRRHPQAAQIVSLGAHAHDDYVAMSGDVHRELVAAGWPPAHAQMIAAAVGYLVLGAAVALTASADQHPLDRGDEATFQLALDSLITGLRSEYERLAHEGTESATRTAS